MAVFTALLAVLPLVSSDPPGLLDQPHHLATVSVEVDTSLPLTVRAHCDEQIVRGSKIIGEIVVLALVDGRHVLRQPDPCVEDTLIFEGVGCGVHFVAVYLQTAIRTDIVAMAEVELPCHSVTTPLSRATTADSGAKPHQVGVYYSTYNGLLRGNSSVVSVEGVLRNRSRTLADAAPNYWQHTPEIGPYCLYRKRPSEAKGIVPDCTDIEKTLKSHASTLIAAGVDYIMLDATNWGQVRAIATTT